MTQQTTMFEPAVIEVDAHQPCTRHGWFNWECYYEDWEVVKMLEEQGWIDCPLCLAEMVGIE